MSHAPAQPEAARLTPLPSREQRLLVSAWSPLREPLFRVLWIATVVSNLGTWMQNVGAAWLMTSLAPSPILVALVQAAANLPVFLVVLPAGALADVVDRRRLLLGTQGWMLAAAAVLGVLTLVGATTPWVLLTLTFVLGLGAAINAPAWQAIMPELVARSELQAAVALNGVGFNLARALGPALGGIIVAAAGVGATFLLNAASFLGVMVVLYRWQPSPRASSLPAEDVIGALRAGLRYVRYAPALRAVLARVGIFILCGSALWALLPIVARSELRLDATGYGMLLGFLGLGALVGAAILPSIRQRVAIDPLLAGATILFAAATATLAYVHDVALLCVAMIGGGIAWMTLMSTLNIAVQTAVPAWVRARALAMYVLVIQGGIAVGSTLWGVVAAHAGISIALLGAALGLVVGLITMVRYRLETGEDLDLTPSMHWHEPIVVTKPHLEDGPVLVTIEYRIDPSRSGDFAAVMRAVRLARRRDGAIRWGLFGDAADPSRYVETFIVESWAEHLRQHERVTVADREVQAQARAFHVGDTPPTASHLISAYAAKGREPED